MNSSAPPPATGGQNLAYDDPDVVQKFEAAVASHQSGDLDGAETAYREILALSLDHPGALNLLGALFQQKGDPNAAIGFLEKAIEIAPNNADFHSNLSAAYFSNGNFDKAEACLETALTHQPDNAKINANMASVLLEQKRFDRAYAFAAKAHRASPKTFKYAKQLGDSCCQTDRFDEAVDAFKACIASDTENAEVRNSLGYSYERLGQLPDAEKYYREALEIRPNSPEILNNLAGILLRTGKEEEGRALYDRALNAPVSDWSDPVRMAVTYMNAGDHERALKIFQQIKESHAYKDEMWANYAVTLCRLGLLEEADKAFWKAIEIDPQKATTWNSLAINTSRRNQLDDAVEQYKKAISISPTYADPYMNLCLTLMFMSRLDEAYLYAHMTLSMPVMREGSFGSPVKIFRALCDYDALDEVGDIFDLAEGYKRTDLITSFLAMLPQTATEEQIGRLADLHFYWGEHLAMPEGTDRSLPPAPARISNSKLKIGFLSSDLKAHSVVNFVLPILRHYDRDQFEIHCYSPTEAPTDKKQALVKDLVDDFHFFKNLDFRQAAEKIHNDGIDVLMELNGFTKDTMINALCYRPAPVQVYWLGYPFTTGMPEMDHILVDSYFAPENTDWLAEEPLLMPESWVSFDSFLDVEIADKLPVEQNGKLTFGTLNAPYKFTPETIAVWATIMKEFDDSQFLLVRPEADSTILQHNLRDHFSRYGVAPERVQFLNNRKYGNSHLAYYNMIDISLDSFPQTGGTTTCDAIWMGVPVISLVGPSMHQRVSYSLLENAGCGELACFSLEEYLQKAVMLGNDITSLREYRHNMRPALLESPLCQGQRFTDNFQKIIVGAYEKSGA